MNIVDMNALATNNLGRKLRVGVSDSDLMLASDQPYNNAEEYNFYEAYETTPLSELGDNAGRDSDPIDADFDGTATCYNGHGSLVVVPTRSYWN